MAKLGKSDRDSQPIELIFADLWKYNEYPLQFFSYGGSLTVPSCEEAALWIVYVFPSKVSHKFVS